MTDVRITHAAKQTAAFCKRKIAVLEAALRPFANVTDVAPISLGVSPSFLQDDDVFQRWALKDGTKELTMGHFRVAKQALDN